MTADIVVIATPTPPRVPWQLGWHRARPAILGVAPLEIARAPAGTPIPAGARQIGPAWRPRLTVHHLDLAQAHYREECATVFVDLDSVAQENPRARARLPQQLADDTLISPVEPLERS